VLQYKPVPRAKLGAIGQQLAVSHVVEGSVRRAGDRVLVNVQLVEAGNAATSLGPSTMIAAYDALTLQGELATEICICAARDARPGEKSRVQAKPTNNAEAYVPVSAGAKLRGLPHRR
jgi:hypothetical protein